TGGERRQRRGRRRQDAGVEEPAQRVGAACEDRRKRRQVGRGGRVVKRDERIDRAALAAGRAAAIPERWRWRSSARSAERGEIVTLHNKTLSARLSPISQDGFPLRPLANARVSKCGGIQGVTTGPQGGQGTRQRGERALSQLVRGVGVRVSSGHVWGYAVGFGAFAVALLKRVMQRRACLPLAGAVFVVLLCAVGLEGEAQAQFGPPTVTNVNPNTGPTSGGTSVTITGTNFSGATAV